MSVRSSWFFMTCVKSLYACMKGFTIPSPDRSTGLRWDPSVAIAANKQGYEFSASKYRKP